MELHPHPVDHELGYEDKRVTDDLLKLHPELSKDSHSFELRTIDYMGERYALNQGLIEPPG